MKFYNYLIEKIDESKRTLKNKPKDISPREWLKIFKPKEYDGVEFSGMKNYDSSWGVSEIDGKYYGWSHRAIHGFSIGDKIKINTCGNTTGKEYIIKNAKEAAQAAANFAEDIS